MINMNFLRSMLQPLSAFFLALAVLALPQLAEAQAPVPYVAGACYGSDPNDPAAIAACIATDSFHYWQDDCTDAFSWYLQAIYFDGKEQGLEIKKWKDFWKRTELYPSCSVLSEARNIFSGEAFPWAPCIPDGNEGTVEHMTACLKATGGLPRRGGFPKPSECGHVYNNYDAQVMQGVFYRQQPENSGDVWDDLGAGQSAVLEGRVINGASLMFGMARPGNGSDGYRLRVNTRPRDCTIAAQVTANFANGNPNWSACTGYSPASPAQHFAACMAKNENLTALNSANCLERREKYEAALISANDGRPEGYTPITCPQIEEGLVLAQQTVAEERAAVVAAQAETAAPAPDRSNGRVTSWFVLILILAINVIILIAATGFAVLNSLRDVRKVPYKREMLRAFGFSFGGWVLAAIVAPAVIQALSGPSPEPGMFWAALLIYSVIGSVGFFGVRLLFVGKHKPPKSEGKVTEDGFVETEENGHILYEDASKTVLVFFMWTTASKAVRFGRIIEIRPDKFIVSPIHRIKKFAWRGPQFKEWYDSGDWAKDAKTYDPDKIEAIRMVSEPRFEGAPPFHIVVMDYGRKHVELNYQEKTGLFKPQIGHVSQDQDYIVRFTKLVAETLKNVRNKSATTEEDFGMAVSFEGMTDDQAEKLKQSAEDMVNSIIEEKEQPKKQPPTHDDPF